MTKKKKIHVPNLCVVQQVCTQYLEIDDISIRWNHCGIREYLFKELPVKQLIDLALAPRQQFNKIVCIAHNAQGFDAQFIFKYIVERHSAKRIEPSVMMNGSKIFLIEIANVKFIDSLNYFHMLLSNLSKAYGLQEIEKGVFHICLTHLKMSRTRVVSWYNVFIINDCYQRVAVSFIFKTKL